MVNIAKYGEKFRKELSKKREKSAKLLVKFIKLADLAISLGGEASFEWPRVVPDGLGTSSQSSSNDAIYSLSMSMVAPVA